MATIKYNPNSHGLPIEWVVSQSMRETTINTNDKKYVYDERRIIANGIESYKRYMRNECHKWFDKLWKDHQERDVYYHQLADALGIDYEQCHFATMSADQLEMALEIVKNWWFVKYDK